MFALIRQRRWLGLLAFALVMCLLFWWLGLWQWHRHQSRSLLNTEVKTAEAQPVVPLNAVMPDALALPPGAENRSVTAAGHYLSEGQMLQRGADGRAGFAVLTPLELDTGGTLLVNRGFVPFSLSQSGAPASDVTPPGGPVRVQVRLRAPEPADERAAPSGQVYSITPQDYPVALPEPVYATYGDLVRQTPPADPALELPSPVDVGLGPHLFYALQWWSFIVIALVGYVVLIRREAAAAGTSPTSHGHH